MRLLPLLLVLSVSGVQAQSLEQQQKYPGKGWFARQENASGGYCCNGYDGHLYYGAYVIEQDGSITLPTPDGDNHVPKDKVLPFNPLDPNPTGTAVVWYGGSEITSSTFIYCFALGPLT